MRRKANRAARMGECCIPGVATMEIEFKCPHCGVVTYFDATLLGKSWPCRSCSEEVEISQREYGHDWDEEEHANFSPLSQPAFEYREIAQDDEIEVVNFRRMRDTSRETEPRAGRGRIAFGLVLFAIIFITAGPILLHSLQSRSYPARKPTIEQQDFRTVLEGLEKSQKLTPRGTLGPNSYDFSDPRGRPCSRRQLSPARLFSSTPKIIGDSRLRELRVGTQSDLGACLG